jgi:hypothetical protein
MVVVPPAARSLRRDQRPLRRRAADAARYAAAGDALARQYVDRSVRNRSYDFLASDKQGS